MIKINMLRYAFSKPLFLICEVKTSENVKLKQCVCSPLLLLKDDKFIINMSYGRMATVPLMIVNTSLLINSIIQL